jgi:hypothetical protein
MRKDDRLSRTGIMHMMIEQMAGKSLDLFYGKVQNIVHVHLYDKCRGCFAISNEDFTFNHENPENLVLRREIK